MHKPALVILENTKEENICFFEQVDKFSKNNSNWDANIWETAALGLL